MEVLERFNSAKLLMPLAFGGGTMLRLCYGMDRYSIDLDFWIVKKIRVEIYFRKCKECLEKFYKIKDAANKFYTILFEISSPNYPRSLKIEIRKEAKDFRYEESIAYSPHSNTQVILKTVSLVDMMKSKIEAFIDRKEIRDCFDIEFLIRRGIDIPNEKETLKKVLKTIDSLKRADYKVKLASLLDEKKRDYYWKNNFKLLKSVITEVLPHI
jgi:hypothetical protein